MTSLSYHIDKNISEQDRCLALHIKFGLEKAPAISSLPALATTKEHKEAIAFLLDQERGYRKQAKIATNNVASLIHVAYPHTQHALKLIAATGSLWLEGKAILCDLFSPTTFYYYLDDTVSGHIKTKYDTFPLAKCEFLCAGPPHFYIKDNVLKFISTNIAWSDLKKVWSGTASPAMLEGEDDVEIVRAPKNEEPAKIQPQEPTPVLVLKDRTGAFGDLWMDYGDQRICYHDPMSQGVRRLKTIEDSWERDLLETAFIKKMVGSTHYFCSLDQVAKSLLFLLELGWKVLDWQGRQILHLDRADLTLHADCDSLILKGKIKFSDYEADVGDVVGAFNRRDRFIQLSSTTVGLVPDSLQKIGIEDAAAEGHVEKEAIRLPRSKIGIFDRVPSVSADRALCQLQERMQNFSGIEPAPPGPLFRGSLRPYQQAGLDWLNFLYDYGFHGILADDMGLGKTVQVLALLSRIKTDKPVLIVMPTSLIFNWEREIECFLPGSIVRAHRGGERIKSTETLQTSQIILTTYATLRIDAPLFEAVQFECVILDESQAIKNAHTQAAQAVFKLRARFRLSITGTPLENRLHEIWSQFRFLIPALFEDAKTFEAELHTAEVDPRYLKRIQKKIRPFILRRKKEDVAPDLPGKIEQTVWIEMSSSQRRLYEQFVSGVKSNLVKKMELEGASKHRMEILETLLRLRQLCCHPLLAASCFEEEAPMESAKMTVLLDDLETVRLEGKKALVYSQFTGMLSLLSKELKRREQPFAYLDGSTVDREKVVRQFQQDPSIPFFLISLKAGGVGLNLTAADYVFLYDPWWNEAAENQAIDRAHRIGRRDTVIAKRYIVLESIEEKMMKLKSHKRLLSESLFEGNDIPSSLSTEDFTYLLS